METISGGGGGRTTDAADITSGTFVKERIPPLPTTKIAEGTFDLARIPSIDDARIPDLETLSYGAAFAEGQIPNLPTSKITSGTFDDARIPNIGLNDLEDVNTAGTVNGKVLTFQSGTWLPETPAGGGDMLKSVYDTDNNSIVDNSERLEGETLATVQAHGVDAGTITQGTIGLVRVPVMDDAHIPNLETLSYGAAFGTAQIPDLPTVKITSGTFNADRIPILPTDRYGSAVLVSGTRFMKGTFNMGSHPIHAVDELTFTHDAKFYTTTDYEVRLESKDEAYYAGLRMGHLKSVYNINTYGTLDMNMHPIEDAHINLYGTFAPGAFRGLFLSDQTAGTALVLGDLVYFKSDGKWWDADADAESTTKGELGLALETIAANSTGKILKSGYIKNTGWSLGVGSAVYVSCTASGITTTPPSGSGDQVRKVGVAHTANIVHFNPDDTVIELS